MCSMEVLVHFKSSYFISTYNFLTLKCPIDLIYNIDVADTSSLLDMGKCQKYGEKWYAMQTSAVLRVPSAIIPMEYNFVINTEHPDFDKIRLVNTELFYQFDVRYAGIAGLQ